MQHLDDRITALEQLVSGKHPNEDAFMAELRHRFATPEERETQAKRAADMVGVTPAMGMAQAEAAQLRNSLTEALARLADLEERERKRNLAQEIKDKELAAASQRSATK